MLVAAGASFSPRISDRVRGVLATSAAAKLYEQSEWNEITAGGDVGIMRLFERGSASGGIGVGRLWTAGEPERRNLGPWARIGWRIPDSTRLDVSLGADRRWYDANAGRDGWRLAVAPRLVHALDGWTSIEVKPTFEAVSADEDHHGSHLIGVGATLSHALERGVSVTLTAGTRVRRHAGPDPLFGMRRVDRTLRLALKVEHTALAA